jgi:hypothetical protein
MNSRLLLMLTALAISVALSAGEDPADKIDLKDGSTLFLHADGTGRMVDAHGKPLQMADGVEMETVSGDIIMMMNKKVWRRHGPTGKGRRALTND